MKQDKMNLEQLTYTPHDKQTSNEHPSTMVMMVDETMLRKYRKDPSVPIAEVMNSFDIFKYETGRSGLLGKPSKQEIEETFGTTNDTAIAEFMLKNGSIHGTSLVDAGGCEKPM